MNKKLTDERIGFLDDAKQFFAFARVWWDGSGLDCISWRSDPDGFHQTLLQTGEVTTFTMPKVVLNKEINGSDFLRVMNRFSSLGVSHLDSQIERIILNHYDCWFGIKEGEHSSEHWVFVAGGRHANPIVTEITEAVYNECPSLMLLQA